MNQLTRWARIKSNYAATTSTVALMIALGGTSYAVATVGSNEIQDDAVLSRHIKDNEVASADVKDFAYVTNRDGTRTAVRGLGTSDLANDSVVTSKILAGTVTTNKLTGRAVTEAKLADNAVTATKLATDSVGSRAIADGSIMAGDLKPSEPWHTVGAAGQPPFYAEGCGSGLVCDAKAADGPPQFYREPIGIVHLRGSACRSSRYNYQEPGSGTCDNNDTFPANPQHVFTLPVGYLPSRRVELAVFGPTSTDFGSAYVTVRPNGDVTYANTEFGGTLDGVDFRAEG